MAAPPEGVIALIECEADTQRRAANQGNQRAAPLVGEIDNDIVMAGAHGGEQVALVAQFAPASFLLPLAVDNVQLANCRMCLQHRPRLFVEQHVDIGLRIALAQRVDNRRGKQHIAVVAQLD